ncbi:hypothetical protein K432DRAFT_350312 [Lepidopterella palustris CBS 459.81]|uniref:GPI-anchored cell wall organization protein Ecm33 n=1 Tax=Lepidopterella palustris CBS 459.81 TaxID=1314670 RepID=A0A8E2ED66_9PEZI|nr:hypothetical protein K432DRAFT_350312 [Lepidopterella palustris CBS 459.81]
MSPLARFVLPALAAAGTAFAASCSVSGTSTLQSQGDATALASCKTFSGSIAIATGTTDAINLPNVQEIDGDFVANNVSLITSIGADSLSTITGKFILNEIQVLSTLNFPRLTTVNDIEWNALPNLQQLTFTSSVTKAGTINIQNTELGSLDGINVQSVDTFYIANNRYLSDITLQLGNVSTSLILEANNPSVNVSFPNLIWAYNMTFRNCSSISVPSLASLNGSMGFYGNDIQTFAAPNLTDVGGSLSFVSNTQLTNISLPLLTSLGGGFQIANNTELKIIDGFPKLKTIVGALDFNGNFTDVQLPSLGDVRGAFNIQSSGDLTKACANFQTLKSSSVIKGSYVCQGSVAKPGGAGTTPTPTSSGAATSKTGAAGRLDVSSSAVMGVSGILAAMFGLL